jgi:glycosyltransferase involved in cell wall biosynthesis
MASSQSSHLVDSRGRTDPARQVREPPGAASSSPIRLLILGQLPPPFGGMEVMTRVLLDGLRQRPEFVIANINTQASRSLAEKGGKHQLRKALRGSLQTARLVKLIASFRPHAIYLPLTSSPSFLGFLRDAFLIAPGLLLRKHVVVHLHNGSYPYAQATGLKGALVRFLMGRVSLAIVLGDRLTSVFQGLIPPDRIASVPNGIDDQPFEAARARTGTTRLPRDRKRILFVGLMHGPKGFRDLLHAIAAVPGGEFVFAGEWPSREEEEEVRAFVRDHGIGGQTTFLGVVTGDAKYDLFTSADIFVLPSHYEGLPVVVLEAMAAGLPIVCTNCGALDLTVKDGWNGFFVPRSSPQVLAARLNQLLDDEGLRRSMGERSRQLYEERFTSSQFVSGFSRAIRDCVLRGG